MISFVHDSKSYKATFHEWDFETCSDLLQYNENVDNSKNVKFLCPHRTSPDEIPPSFAQIWGDIFKISFSIILLRSSSTQINTTPLSLAENNWNLSAHIVAPTFASLSGGRAVSPSNVCNVKRVLVNKSDPRKLRNYKEARSRRAPVTPARPIEGFFSKHGDWDALSTRLLVLGADKAVSRCSLWKINP